MEQVELIGFVCANCRRRTEVPSMWLGIRVRCKHCGIENLVSPTSGEPELPEEPPEKPGKEHKPDPADPLREEAVRQLIDSLELVDLGCRKCGKRARYNDETCTECGSTLKFKEKHRKRALMEESKAILEELADVAGTELPVYEALTKYATISAVADVLEHRRSGKLIARFSRRISVSKVLQQCRKLAKAAQKDPDSRAVLAELPRSWLIVKGAGPEYDALMQRVGQWLSTE